MDTYVCITHRKLYPCNIPNEYHLISNWPADVKKILDIEDDPRYYYYD